MKRPLAVIGFSGMIAQCLAMWANPSFAFLAGGVLLGTGIVLILRRADSALRAATLTAGIMLLLTGGLQRAVSTPVRALDGVTATVTGTVTEQNESNGTYLTVTDARIAAADGTTLAARQKLRIYLSAPIAVAPYDRITLRQVRLSAPQDGFGPTARSHYESQGIFLTGFAASYHAAWSSPAHPPWYAFVSDWRAALQNAVRSMLPPETAGILDAMVLGNRQSLSAETQIAFRRCGMSALLVVSGMHLSYLIGGLLQLLTKTLRIRRLAAALCIPATVLLMALTGFTGSGVRAGTAMILYLVAVVAMRRADPINSLGAAAIVLLILQPLCAGNVGVQLSFLSTAGILYWAPKWTARAVSGLSAWAQIGKPRAFVALLMVSAAATAATAPLTALIFGEWSVIGIGMNLLAALPAQAVLLGGACAAVFGALGCRGLAYPAAWCAGQAARLLRWGTALGSRCPVLTDWDGWMVRWVALVLAVAGVLMLCRASRKARRIAAIGCVLLLAIPVWSSTHPRNTLTAVRCGDGLAVCVGRTLLLDGTSAALERNVRRAFTDMSVDEILILSADAEPAARAAAALANRGKVQRIYFSGAVCPDALRRIAGKCTVLPLDGQTRPTAKMRLFPGTNGGWIQIGTVLVAYGTADVADLPVQARSPDVWVTSNVPLGAAEIRANVTLLSCAGWTEAQRLSQLVPTHGTIYTTAQNGTLRAPLDDNRKGAIPWHS